MPDAHAADCRPHHRQTAELYQELYQEPAAVAELQDELQNELHAHDCSIKEQNERKEQNEQNERKKRREQNEIKPRHSCEDLAGGILRTAPFGRPSC